ncbi:MAG: hypothetical protein IAE94_09595 [Chthoniobacterales bacterium]|nr:hypothetical protein [Chthoniobacterales bacterium]
MNPIIIDNEFRSLVPPPSADELEQLEQNIISDGCREPLVVWQDTLIDGHNRHSICSKHNIPYTVAEKEFESREGATLWIIDNQVGRRNLQPIDRVPLLEKKRAILRAQAAERKMASLLRGPESPVAVNLPERENGEVNESLASQAGVSRKTYEHLKDVAENGAEELKQAVREKRIGASTAAELSTLPKEEQAALVALPKKEIVEAVKKSHVSNATGEFEWYSPHNLIASGLACMGSIDLDPASCAVANENVKAAEYYTKEDDGLKNVWFGNVWLNPPYASSLIREFAEMAASKYEEGEYEQACILVNNATDTNWFHRLLEVASAICLIKGRVRFIDRHGNPGGIPLQGQVVIYIGKQPKSFLEAFREHGRAILL